MVELGHQLTGGRAGSGEVVIEGENVAAMGDKQLSAFRNRRIGFIFQFHHLLPEFTALENVAMPGMIAGKSFSEIRPRAEELLTDVGLAERLEHRPGMLSGGEAQRIRLAAQPAPCFTPPSLQLSV